ncbi:MAG: hypothetical protein OXH70_11645 [Acidobacteria bacterium]|nr:hypothetical protein [Acidobacteriota bacterium]
MSISFRSSGKRRVARLIRQSDPNQIVPSGGYRLTHGLPLIR